MNIPDWAHVQCCIQHLTMIQIFQGIILILSGASIYYMGGGMHKRAFILNIIAAPFWWYSNYYTGLWGYFILSVWHTGNTVRGLINHKEENA